MSDELIENDLTLASDSAVSNTPANQSDALVGQVIARQYRVDALLGSGGMSSVYHVTDLALGRESALKILKAGLALDAKQMMRFQQEGRVLDQLSHEHIVKVHHFGFIEDGRPYLVMELVKGVSLSQLVARSGKLSRSRTLNIVQQICEGLAHAHARSVIHRDLKPSNIMLTNTVSGDDFVKIVDFGIAKMLSEQAFQNLTATGDVFGSPLYMSPEQCGGLAVDSRTDIYSLGCIAYECLTGEPPFVGKTSVATMMQHQADTPLTLCQATGGEIFPQELETVVARMLSKRPEGRYESVRELVAALNVVSASAPPNFPKDSSAASKSKQLAAPLAIAAVVLICGGSFFLSYEQTKPKKGILALPSAPAHISREPDPDLVAQKQETGAAADPFIPDPYVFAAERSSGVALRLTKKLTPPTGAFMEALSTRPLTAHLEYLDMTNSGLSDGDLHALVKLPLRAIVLRNNRGLRNADCLAFLPSLRKLDLFDTGVADEGLSALNANLVDLNLGRCTITNRTLRKLANLKHLRRLSLWGDTPPLDDGSLQLLENLKSLDYLVLRSNNFSEKALSALIAHLPGCSIETEALPNAVCLIKRPGTFNLDEVRNVRLRCINVNGNRKFDEARLREIEHHPHLYSLFANDTALKPSSLRYLNPRLKRLSLAELGIDDQGVEYIEEHLKDIRELRLCGNNLTDASLRSFAAMKTLDLVDLRNNPQLTLKAVRRLLVERPGMVVETDDRLR